ncbi:MULTISPECIES: hypothetical protein [unclassified Afipia]|uniref:hypothetical protein n=1 Tax=unclassified Afipia TaxID=2642050 RepID=UPI0004B7C2DF|nr:MULTISPECIES: hypothetical protein [unclassified Afipia]MCR6736132.1 hypothetical protein [Afipia sp.]
MEGRFDALGFSIRPIQWAGFSAGHSPATDSHHFFADRVNNIPEHDNLIKDN